MRTTGLEQDERWARENPFVSQSAVVLCGEYGLFKSPGWIRLMTRHTDNLTVQSQAEQVFGMPPIKGDNASKRLTNGQGSPALIDNRATALNAKIGGRGLSGAEAICRH